MSEGEKKKKKRKGREYQMTLEKSIDHFYKWQHICYSFIFMLIKTTGLTLV